MPLRIATFNLKDFFLARNEAETDVVEGKVANIAQNLRRADADVVALQEVGSMDLLDRLLGTELASLGYGAPVAGTEDKRGIRCVILTRLPVLWSQVHAPKHLAFPHFLDGDPDPFDGRIPLRRGVVHVRFDAGPLGEVDVITAHFKSKLGVPVKTHDGVELPDPSLRGRGEAAIRSFVQRAAEALFIRGLVDDVFRALPDHAVVVTGDLNDGVHSLPVRIVRGLGEPSPSILRPATELVPPERRFTTFHGGFPSLIDHVLVSERLFRHVQGVSIFNEALRDHGPHTDDAPLAEDSDHALVTVTFDV